jgi:hypothetical protein
MPEITKPTEERIAEIVRKYPDNLGHVAAQKIIVLYKEMAAQEVKDIAEAVKAERKRIVEWSDSPCPHSWGKYPNLGSRKGCQRCWKELVTQIGDEEVKP